MTRDRKVEKKKKRETGMVCRGCGGAKGGEKQRKAAQKLYCSFYSKGKRCVLNNLNVFRKYMG